MPVNLANAQSQNVHKLKDLRKLVSTQVSKSFVHQDIVRDIANNVLLSYINENSDIADIDVWVSAKINRFTESYIKELWQFSYQCALQVTRNGDLSQDLAQISIISLLQAKKPIQFVKAWLKGTIQNQAALTQKGVIRNDKLCKELVHNKISPSIAQSCPEADLDKAISESDVSKLLSQADYKIYWALKRYPTIKAYAAAKGISYSTARETKNRVITNLKANYLRKQGWMDSPAILSYRNLVNLKRFMDTILERAITSDFSGLFHYASQPMIPSLRECFSGFTTITRWGIHQNQDGSFRLWLMDVSRHEKPITVFLIITLNKANYLRIKDCYLGKLMGIVPAAKLGPLPVEKGRCLLTIDQIQAYL